MPQSRLASLGSSRLLDYANFYEHVQTQCWRDKTRFKQQDLMKYQAGFLQEEPRWVIMSVATPSH